jgi:enolase
VIDLILGKNFLYLFIFMPKTYKIKSMKAREVLDSRGNPTLEVDLVTDQGMFQAQVPSGASEGHYEALELRDGGKRYHGKGVAKAVKNVNDIITPKIKGKDPSQQKEIDSLLIELDGTENKSHLGANAILAVSLAVCRAGAANKKIPLYKHLSRLFSGKLKKELPLPSFNVINGGAHAGNDLDIQEFMIVPQKRSFSENLRSGSEIYHTLKEILKAKYGEGATNLGDEGGFSPPLRLAKEALDLIQKAVDESGYKNKVKIILDAAASEFYKKKEYRMNNLTFTSDGLLNFYSQLFKSYPILALEDPFAEDDWEGFQKITERFGKKIIIFGDDLLATNKKRIEEAEEKKACNGLLLKIDQIGTVTEALEAALLAQSFGWKIMVSHRSGDTCDSFIADLAFGIGADFIKAGAPARGERVVKYNRLLKIEEEIKNA